MTNPTQATSVEKGTPSTVAPAAGTKIDPTAVKVEPSPGKADEPVAAKT